MQIHRLHAPAALPDALRPLGELVRDCWAGWHPDVADVVRAIDEDAWARSGEIPLRALQGASPEALARAAADEELIARVAALTEARAGDLRRDPPVEEADRGLLVAYFSCEFGLDQSLPIYSGGLGLLAGDHLKAAADLALPLVGVGLLYRRGYFRQEISPDGRQVERYPVNDPATLPVEAVLGDDGAPLRVDVRIGTDAVTAALWSVSVGSVRLILLDADVPENAPEVRGLTDTLYGGDRRHRIRQELLLGVGGVRALRALDLHPTVFHINEGHSAFLTLERMREVRAAHGLSVDEALEAVRAAAVFTTHTPVPAGNEVFDAALVAEQAGPMLEEVGMSWPQLAALGQSVAGEEAIGMTVLALRGSGHANGVSRLHGEVAREMWHGLWPGLLRPEIPIGHVTNGVHTWSWMGPEMRGLIARACGSRPIDDPGDPEAWSGMLDADPAAVWAARGAQRERLLQAVSARAPEFDADPNALVIGFSRRFATYKRAGLLLRDPDRLIEILDGADRPVRLIVSGKAHGADEPGKELIHQIVAASRDPRLRGRIVFLPDYDISGARLLVQGSDVWLNTPRRPFEASGTSGMKAAANGALNLSILDGWWAEGYSPSAGWAIGTHTSLPDEGAQDALDAASLLDLLETAVLPTFFADRVDGVPRAWIAMVARAVATLAPAFSTHRMVRDYLALSYLPAHRAGLRIATDGYAPARAASAWRASTASAWPGVAIGDVTVSADPGGGSVTVQVVATLGSLTPADVAAEVVVGSPTLAGDLAPSTILEATASGGEGVTTTFTARVEARLGDGLAVRLRARREGVLRATGDAVLWEAASG